MSCTCSFCSNVYLHWHWSGSDEETCVHGLAASTCALLYTLHVYLSMRQSYTIRKPVSCSYVCRLMESMLSNPVAFWKTYTNASPPCKSEIFPTHILRFYGDDGLLSSPAQKQECEPCAARIYFLLHGRPVGKTHHKSKHPDPNAYCKSRGRM